jgi:hypothetical protein
MLVVVLLQSKRVTLMDHKQLIMLSIGWMYVVVCGFVLELHEETVVVMHIQQAGTNGCNCLQEVRDEHFWDGH